MSWFDLPADFNWTLVKYETLIAGGVDFRTLEKTLDLELHEGSRPGSEHRWNLLALRP